MWIYSIPESKINILPNGIGKVYAKFRWDDIAFKTQEIYGLKLSRRDNFAKKKIKWSCKEQSPATSPLGPNQGRRKGDEPDQSIQDPPSERKKKPESPIHTRMRLEPALQFLAIPWSRFPAL
jgi:hypothetical protein